MKINDLSQLKQALKEQTIETSINALKNEDYEKAVLKSKDIRDINVFPKQYWPLMAEAHYQVAKNYQIKADDHLCIKNLNKSLKFKSDFYHARKRIELIKSCLNKKKGQTIFVRGEKIFLTHQQIKMADIREFRNKLGIPCWTDCSDPIGESYFNCAQCKKLIKIPSKKLRSKDFLKKVYRVGIYRWRGDPNASETYSQLLLAFKSNQPDLAKHFANLLSDFFYTNNLAIAENDILVSVPADPERWTGRGYNPPTALAKELSKNICIPFIDNLFDKKVSPRAKDLSFYELSNNYSVKSSNEKRLVSRNVLLIDDITTRGYTLSTCAKLLINKLGAKSVSAAVLAQSVST
ncbi:ComF family protein [Thermodesulfobacteriota bacterium]